MLKTRIKTAVIRFATVLFLPSALLPINWSNSATLAQKDDFYLGYGGLS